MSTFMGRPTPKIFCIGMNKTGTTSVESAFRNMGLRLGRQRDGERLLEDWRAGRFDRILDLARTADAFQDVPFSLPGTYEVLDAEFPDAKFVLTVRSSAERWFESIDRFTRKRLGVDRAITAEDLRDDPYVSKGWSWRFWESVFDADPRNPLDAERLMKVYRRHNEAVLRHFQDRPDRLLVLDVGGADAAGRLSRHVGRSLGRGGLPCLNASTGPERRHAA